MAHLLEVSSIVLQHGGDEDEAIAGLLHDAPEDAGGRPRLEDIRLKFGDRVADIVDGCTDTYDHPKPAWRPRKEAYLARIPDALAVGAAGVGRRQVRERPGPARRLPNSGRRAVGPFQRRRRHALVCRAAADAFLAVERTSARRTPPPARQTLRTLPPVRADRSHEAGGDERREFEFRIVIGRLTSVSHDDPPGS